MFITSCFTNGCMKILVTVLLPNPYCKPITSCLSLVQSQHVQPIRLVSQSEPLSWMNQSKPNEPDPLVVLFSGKFLQSPRRCCRSSHWLTCPFKSCTSLLWCPDEARSLSLPSSGNDVPLRGVGRSQVALWVGRSLWSCGSIWALVVVIGV